MTVKQNHSKRDQAAHVMRRLIHLSIWVVPCFYYYFLVPHTQPKIRDLLILSFIFLVFLFEKFRIRMRLVLFGQRFYEATRISAFAWTMLSLSLVLMLSPSVDFAMPIIATCALVDPLLGEMRLRHVKKSVSFGVGLVLALLIWIVCGLHYHFSLWFVFLGPVAVIAEWPTLKWIDDNALMMLLPLVFVLITAPSAFS